MTPEIVVIAGPTASGKTGLGVRLAERLGGEVVSADSRQIYRYMDVGTAKPTPDETRGIPHHLIDIVDPDQTYSASQFASAAAETIESIIDRGRMPIVVGGSGFYLEALFQGLSPIPDIPEEVRAEIAARVRSDPVAAHTRLQSVDPVAADRFPATDPQRVARALEVHAASGRTLSHFQSLPREPGTRRRSVSFGLEWPRAHLYERINLRTRQMLEDGLINEVEALFSRGYDRETYALKTFGYREIGAYLDGEMDLATATDAISQGTRRYAKRQLTWFRNRSDLTWVPGEGGDPLPAVCGVLERSGIPLDSGRGA